MCVCVCFYFDDLRVPVLCFLSVSAPPHSARPALKWKVKMPHAESVLIDVAVPTKLTSETFWSSEWVSEWVVGAKEGWWEGGWFNGGRLGATKTAYVRPEYWDYLNIGKGGQVWTTRPYSKEENRAAKRELVRAGEKHYRKRRDWWDKTRAQPAVVLAVS